VLANGLRASEGLQRPEPWPKLPFSGHTLVLAPNPVRDNAVIRYHLGSDGEASLELISESGSLVMAWQLRGEPNSDSEMSVQLDGVAPGIYILVLYETRNGASAAVATFKVSVRA
jgi:hypothetical protein